MTVRRYVECPSCGCIIVLKLQIDFTIYKGWHLSYVCPECGDKIEMSIDSSLNLPYSIDCDEVKSGYILGYNPLLPNSSINYFFKFDDPDLIMASLCVFMALHIEEVDRHMAVVSMIKANVLHLSNIFTQLLPMLLRNNAPAFSKKLATLLGNKQYRDVDNPTEAYEELISATYKNFSSQPYLSIISPIMSEYQNALKHAPSSDMASMKDKMKELGIVIGKWKRDKAYPAIAHYVERIGDYLQSIYHFNNGDFSIPHDYKLFTTTISAEKALAQYSEAYECYSSIFPFMIAVTNYCDKGSVDDFGSPDPKFNSLDAFCKLSIGNQIEVIENNAHPANNWLLSSLSNDIRNGYSHSSYEYDTLTQVVRIYDKDHSSKVIHEESLMDVCQRTHILILHIIEAMSMGNLLNSVTK